MQNNCLYPGRPFLTLNRKQRLDQKYQGIYDAYHYLGKGTRPSGPYFDCCTRCQILLKKHPDKPWVLLKAPYCTVDSNMPDS